MPSPDPRTCVVWWKVRLAPMALFATEVLRIPYWSADFWTLPRSAFVAARIYHEDRVDAQNEEMEKAQARAKNR